MVRNMQLSKDIGMSREGGATERAELERKREAVKTALFLLALSLAVQVVQYLWLY
jgi:hypothetical protein